MRAKHDFFEVCRTPSLATLVTLQPIDRYASLLDGSIIFSDILVIPQSLGLEVEMIPGPHFPSPLSTPELIQELLERETDPERCCKRLEYVYEAVQMTRYHLAGRVPLLGFVGSPWTLFAYMTEGGSGSKTSFSTAKRYLLDHPDLSHRLLALIADVCARHLVHQIRAGAQMVQVFDSWAGELSASDFRAFSLPYLASIASDVKRILAEHQQAPVPMVVFARGIHQPDLLKEIASPSTGYQVVSIDWSLSPSYVRSTVGPAVVLQGNLDPTVLLSSSPAVLKAKVAEMFDESRDGFGGGGRHVANLGHGITPGVDPEMMRAFLEAVHEEGTKAAKRAGGKAN